MPIDMRMGPILKRNAEYWAKRFIELEKLTAHQSERYIKNLEEVFKESSENIENQIMKFYARFADIENISFSEARKLLNSEDLEAFRMSLEEYIKFARKNSENFDPELAKALEEASLKYRVTRLEALEYGLSGEVGKLMSHEHSILYEACAHAYVDRYYHTAFELFKGYGVGTTFSLIDNKRLEMILDQPWAADGSNFSQRIWVDRKKVTQTLSTRLAQACITGESYTKTLKKVGKELNTSLSNAARLVVTESSYFASRSQKECFDALGCDKYRIIATLDNRTSIICQSLDGEVFKTKEFIAGVSAPPFHPNCRTTTCPYFDDSDVPGWVQGTRTARNPGEKTYRIPADMNYEQWRKKYKIEPIYGAYERPGGLVKKK